MYNDPIAYFRGLKTFAISYKFEGKILYGHLVGNNMLEALNSFYRLYGDCGAEILSIAATN